MFFTYYNSFPLYIFFIIYDHLTNIVRIYHVCELWRDKSVLRITVWHHEACRVMTNGAPEGQIFASHDHTNSGFFFLLNIVYFKISFQKSLYTPRCIISRCRHFDITMTSLDDHVREFSYIYTTNVHPSYDSLDKITGVR